MLYNLTLKIVQLPQQVEDRKTPLQLSMNELGKQLSYLSFGIIGLIVIIGLVQGMPWLEMFTIGGKVLSQLAT